MGETTPKAKALQKDPLLQLVVSHEEFLKTPSYKWQEDTKRGDRSSPYCSTEGCQNKRVNYSAKCPDISVNIYEIEIARLG